MSIFFGRLPDTLWDGGQYFLKLRFSVFFGGFDGLNMTTVVSQFCRHIQANARVQTGLP
jgi:hypothetical protein